MTSLTFCKFFYDDASNCLAERGLMHYNYIQIIARK